VCSDVPASCCDDVPASCCDDVLPASCCDDVLPASCQLEDSQPSCDDASFVLKTLSLVLMLMMLQPLCCDIAAFDVVSALCCY
jgi:hypothetical protein